MAELGAGAVAQVPGPTRHVRAAIDDRHRQRHALVAEGDQRAARQRPVRDADQRLGQRLAARRAVAVEARAVPRDVAVVMPPPGRRRPTLADRARRRGLAGRVEPEPGTARIGGRARSSSSRRSRFPADRAPGSWGWIVIAVPAQAPRPPHDGRDRGPRWRRGWGPCEPTGPGTATMARMAMSAMLATTFRRRTSDPTVARMAGLRWFRCGSSGRPKTWQHRSRCPPGRSPATARSTSDARSRRCRVARATRRSAWRRAAPGALPAHPPARRPWRSLQDGDTSARRRGDPGADCALDGVPALLGLDVDAGEIPSGHPLVAQLARRFPGVRIPRSGAVLDALVPAILEQKVTGEAARAPGRA